ncbi:hypothetical protein Pla123a_22540 [Posidoniimonas polymericola]|uniref:PEP-CTERM protein-sorting domain-containing protein n=1 Tax=Posidoniimonas polymericola TaxID=2528002 RepID=A0A5C5YPG1_9BACT|nr:LamG domain-containing protein [Posidoniimonas polymericola]TWT76831.1 hypothetical protein Pla123a_22540 [Posidoniimonas polymericola]
MRMSFVKLTLCGLVAAALTPCASASTVAHWRFEAGPADSNIAHLAGDDAGNTYSADVPDVSGNGHDLSAWVTGGCCGFAYRTETPAGSVPAIGATNNFSVQNTGGGPGMFTGPTGIESITPGAFTIEASFKLENGGYRTVVGRDSTDVVDANRELAAVYFQAMPNNQFAVKFADQDGYFHEAISPENAIITWDPGSQTSDDAHWYNAVGVSDGSMLSLYLADATLGTGYQLITTTDLTASGSTNTAMATPAGAGGDWIAGNWTVGRGMYNGGHGDRGYGFIDEVRISDSALAPSEFLFAPEPSSVLLGLIGVLSSLSAARIR